MKALARQGFQPSFVRGSFRIAILQDKFNLPKLLDLAIKGEEIVITQDDKPVVKISPIKRPLKRGSAKGKVWMSDDFDEPLEDFQEYME